ncbi:MAG: F0F1 ATP synthase subunit delta [Verrucomicrobiota bacterium]
MKRDKRIISFAKKLVELSKDNGVVTEARVTEVLAGLKKVNHSRHLSLLKAYLTYLRREVALQTAVVSTPQLLSPEAIQIIEANYTKAYGRPITASIQQDPSLIAGLRVRVGDDVYDSSVAGRLQRLAENVK